MSTTERGRLEGRVAECIGAAFGIARGDAMDSSFLLSGAKAFSSFSLLELILRLEEAFGIQIPDQDLDLERFETVQTIADYVERRLATRDAG